MLKLFSFSLVLLALSFGLLGCGNPERQKARQNFKEKIAALKVCTQGSTYSEFRQAEMDLKTSYEVNKSYLEDVGSGFDSLTRLMVATDACWSYHNEHPRYTVTEDVWDAAKFISPEIATKTTLTWDQMQKDPDYSLEVETKRGLTKIAEQAETILNLLDNKK